MNEADSAHSDLAPLDAARLNTLEWKQPRRGHREWVLEADGVAVARLVWRGVWNRGYSAHTAGREWTIVHGLLGRHRLETRDGEPVASSRRSGFRAVTIERAAAEPLFFRRTGWFRSEHRIENREGFPLVVLRRHRSFLRTGAALALEDAGRSLPDLLPLVLLAWCLVLAELHRHAH